MSGVHRVANANINAAVQKFFEAAEEKVLKGEAEEKVEGGMLYNVSMNWEHYTPNPHRQVLDAPEYPVCGAACSLHF